MAFMRWFLGPKVFGWASAAWLALAAHQVSIPTIIGTSVAPTYLHYRSVTVDHTKVGTADSSNFPVLVSGTYTYLKTVGNGGEAQSSSGYDIGFFSDTGCSLKLSWEVETWSGSTGAVNYWVQVPTLSHTSDTVFYLCYDSTTVTTDQSNANGTWDSKFSGVWHLKEDPSGSAPQMADSTSGAHNGTSNGSMASGNQVTAKIDGGLDFSVGGCSCYITLANGSGLDRNRTDAFSLSAWVQPVASGTGAFLSKETNPSPVTGWFAEVDNAGRLEFDLANNNSPSNRIQVASPNSSVGSAGYHYLVVTYSGSSAASGVTLYVDGTAQTPTVLSDSLTGSTTTSATPQINGRSGTGLLDGSKIDEARVYAIGTVLTQSWITSEYNNQSSPSTFYTVGSEQ